MKIFNISKCKHKSIKTIEFCLIPLGWVLRQIKTILISKQKPAIVIIDGFLIGDTVLLGPLIKQIIDKYEITHRIVLVAGVHSKLIMQDFLSKIDILEYQFPWATYDYGFSSLKKLFLLWAKLYKLNIDIAIECRGDFRSIALTYLTYPKRLIGFNFTGGDRLLTDIIPDDGIIVHLFEHIARIGKVLQLKADANDVRMDCHCKILSQSDPDKQKVAISFAGSQILRTMPYEEGLQILNRLAEDKNLDAWYIIAPQEKVFTESLINDKFNGQIRIFKGDFTEYFNFLASLDVYIGMDSGGGHLCSLLGIPSVIVFGTQNSWYCSPIGNHKLLCLETKENLACRPCDGVNCINKVFQKCLKSINIEEIFVFIKNV